MQNAIAHPKGWPDSLSVGIRTRSITSTPNTPASSTSLIVEATPFTKRVLAALMRDLISGEERFLFFFFLLITSLSVLRLSKVDREWDV